MPGKHGKRANSIGDLRSNSDDIWINSGEKKQRRSKNKQSQQSQQNPALESSQLQSSGSHMVDDVLDAVANNATDDSTAETATTQPPPSTLQPVDTPAADVQQPAAIELPAQSASAVPVCDVTLLRSDVNQIKASMKLLRGSVNAMRTSLTNLTTESAANMTSVKSQLNSQQQDVAAAQSVLTSELLDLGAQVKKQQETIATMMIQISFMLSFLCISVPDPAASDGRESNTDKTDNTGKTINRQAPSSYSTAAAAGAATSSSRPSDQRQMSSSRVQSTRAGAGFREMVRSAIQDDIRARDKRAKTIIVSGLAARDGCTDKENVSQLISTEFDTQPNIAYCRRLGEPEAGRVRPLLVALSSASEASWLVSNAKWLRHSHDHTVRQCVFINANRTKEEARVAYEQRCRRRERAGQESTRPSRAAGDADGPGSGSTHGSRVVVNSGRQASRNDNARRDTQQLPGSSRAQDRFNPLSSARPANAASPHRSSTSTPSRLVWSGQVYGAAPGSSREPVVQPRQESKSMEIGQSTATSAGAFAIPTAPSMDAPLVKPVNSSTAAATNQQPIVDRTSPSATFNSFNFNVAAAEFNMPTDRATVAVVASNEGSCASRIDRL
jgi:hypothetical protein